MEMAFFWKSKPLLRILQTLDRFAGLYSSFVPPLIYAIMGSSQNITIGPVSVVSLLLGTLPASEIDPAKNPVDYRRLAFTDTFFAGVTQATLGILRLGFLIDFLFHAAAVGFMGGAAATIALQQLKGFLGIKDFTKKSDLVSIMNSVISSEHHGWNWKTIVIGAIFLVFLLGGIFKLLQLEEHLQLDGNKEIVALGTMNIVGSMTSCYIAAG